MYIFNLLTVINLELHVNENLQDLEGYFVNVTILHKFY